MACTRDTNYQNPNGIQPNTVVKRVKYIGGYPSFKPIINNLSINTSTTGIYTVVYINGSNFLPPSYGTTFVNFGSYKNLPVTFYSSFNISFIIPLQALPGFYNISVVNVYNSNFSPAINQSYHGNLNYSNSIEYKLTTFSYTLSGSYTINSNENYNTIITFIGNGTFNVINNYSNTSINYIMVGGGGGGGGAAYAGGGAGGGGQVLMGTFNSSLNNYNIVIGKGGSGGIGSSEPTDGIAGGITSFIGNNFDIIANGGQPGYRVSNPSVTNGYLNGGNSGAGGLGGLGAGNSFAGNNPGQNGTNGGGGGGGQYGNGNGGNGGSNNINLNYGGGGGGGAGVPELTINKPDGGMGVGGGGNGGDYNNPNNPTKNGHENTGGGGGGGYNLNNGGNGGSGVLILSFNN